jgi:REP element-mobilizing transposase RayT
MFTIDLCAYAVMSNHYHIILHVDTHAATSWSEQEVIDCWQRLFSLPVIVQRYLAKEPLSRPERYAVTELTIKWRQRLQEISWFMRCLNEPIARQANQEDGCTGRYWEGRFKSQALLDDKALAACMAYVDLNPVRAGLAETPEQSEYTSLKERSHKLKQSSDNSEGSNTPSGLLPFAGYPREDMPKGLAFRLNDYLRLVDWTGRAILENKRGFVPQHAPPILDRLQLDTKHWLYMAQHFESRFNGLVGASQKLKAAYTKLQFR